MTSNNVVSQIEADNFDKIFDILKICAQYNALRNVKLSTIILTMII